MVTTQQSSKTSAQKFCWIHIRDVHMFLKLGANPNERRIGQNIKLDLSLQIPYRNTRDKLKNTIDYSIVIQELQDLIKNLKTVNLLEFLGEEILNFIGDRFPKIKAARLTIQKGYAPLANFTGSIAIQVERDFF